MTEAAQIKETPQAQTIVTGETLREFQLGKLGISADEPPKAEEAKPVETKQENEEIIPEDGTMDGGRVVFRGKWVDKKDVGYRMHLKTEAAKAEKARADALEARIKELEALQQKEEKPKHTGKPTPDQYNDLDEYTAAIEKWGREQAVREYEEKQKEAREKEQQAKVMEAWQKQLAKARKELEDYDEVLESSPVKQDDFSAAIQSAIVESEVGARLLYYFAQHPDVVNQLKDMTLTAALRKLGKIEVELEEPEKKPTKQVQKSSAPAPIKPVATGTASKSTDSYFDENGEFIGTIAEYKQLRKEGKIK